MKILLDKNKPYFKAKLHCHSTKSDGRLTVEQLKTEYKKRGYSIVAFTDHEHLIDNSHLTDEGFLAITACEVAIKQFANQSTLKNFDMRVVHLNFYALDPHNTLTPCYSSLHDHFINDSIRDQIRFDGQYERSYSPDAVNTMIRIAREKGFIVSYNHPTWSLETAEQYLQYDNLFAVEICNFSCEQAGHVSDERVFDDMLRSGKRIFCTAADDNHNGAPLDSPYCDSFGGWVQINASALDYTTVMTALQQGDFYASTGPQIFSLTQDGDTVRIETSPCKKIALITKGRRAAQCIAPLSETISQAEFPLKATDGYFHIRVEDEHGKKAYTQAYEVCL